MKVQNDIATLPAKAVEMVHPHKTVKMIRVRRKGTIKGKPGFAYYDDFERIGDHWFWSGFFADYKVTKRTPANDWLAFTNRGKIAATSRSVGVCNV